MVTKRKANPQPGGRPTKYDPSYCEKVVAFMKQGFSLAAFAGEIDVARSTINEWIANFPEFSDAVTRGKNVRLLHWERAAVRVAQQGGGPGTATIIMFGLKNMGGDEWTAPEKVEHSGPNGGAIEVKTIERRIVRPADRDA